MNPIIVDVSSVVISIDAQTGVIVITPKTKDTSEVPVPTPIPGSTFLPVIPGMRAFSLAPIVSGYNGPALQVQRADGQTLDIGFTAGKLDVVAAKAFGTDLRAIRVYDQYGGKPLIGDPATAPTLYLRDDSLPCLLFRFHQFLTLPDDFKTTTQALSFFHAGRLPTQRMPTAVLNWGDEAKPSFSLCQTYQDWKPQILTSDGSMYTAGNYAVQGLASPSVFGVVCGSDATKYHRDNLVDSINSVAKAPIEGKGRLFGPVLPFADSRADTFAVVLVPSAITNTDEVKSALRNVFNTAIEPKANILFHGDSITEGVGAEHNLTITRQVELAFNDPSIHVRCFGKSGDQMEDDFATWWFGDKYIEGPNNILFVWLGTNDVSLGKTAQQVIDRYNQYINGGNGFPGARQRGWNKIIGVTALPRADLTPEKEAERQKLNTSIRAKMGGLLDDVFDVDAIPELAKFATDSVLSPDHLHPSEPAYDFMRPELKKVIERNL